MYSAIKALKQLEMKGSVALVGTDLAIPFAIQCAENLKNIIIDLHEAAFLKDFPDTSKIRIRIKLKFIDPDVTSPGYKEVISENEVREKTVEELKEFACDLRNQFETELKECISLGKNINSTESYRKLVSKNPRRRLRSGRSEHLMTDHSNKKHHQMKDIDRLFWRESRESRESRDSVERGSRSQLYPSPYVRSSRLQLYPSPYVRSSRLQLYPSPYVRSSRLQLYQSSYVASSSFGPNYNIPDWTFKLH
jgi:hypothetical protein